MYHTGRGFQAIPTLHAAVVLSAFLPHLYDVSSAQNRQVGENYLHALIHRKTRVLW
jgi:hypothetical protein